MTLLKERNKWEFARSRCHLHARSMGGGRASVKGDLVVPHDMEAFKAFIASTDFGKTTLSLSLSLLFLSFTSVHPPGVPFVHSPRSFVRPSEASLPCRRRSDRTRVGGRLGGRLGRRLGVGGRLADERTAVGVLAGERRRIADRRGPRERVPHRGRRGDPVVRVPVLAVVKRPLPLDNLLTQLYSLSPFFSFFDVLLCFLLHMSYIIFLYACFLSFIFLSFSRY